ncbi:YrrS family protein [Bacillus sp. DJP31]|uniref:YrrS family protein n=1 Tax=Bacillus sp. DJP31 TaxID=3409789 RepID=UPI003BB62A01
MQVDFKDLYEGPRFEKRAKNRRFNKLINISIVLLFIFISFFTYNLFFGGKSEPASSELAGETSEGGSEETTAADDEIAKEEAADEESNEDTKEVVEDENGETSEEDNETVENNSNDPNVKQTIVNESWKPVGTEQLEPHVAVYDAESADWKEMIEAFQYATGLNEQDWILWRVGNDGSAQSAKGVVSTKDKKTVYRVYIEWVQNEGWKPSRLEQLNEVPLEYTGDSDTNETTETEDSSE